MTDDAVWPGYALIEADTYTISQDSDVERTPFDDGMVRQEKRPGTALTVRQITAHLKDDAALRRFRQWAQIHAHGWIVWIDPEDGVAREVRVRGGAGAISYSAQVSGGRRAWRLTCELEGYHHRIITVTSVDGDTP